ncbi:MAG: AAA family ATPase [Chloroflexi bacterium]|nr:AAA family ATPase [Chloroflexota bacterium]
MIQALLQPLAYPEEVISVELAETHISYLLFTDRHVYKIRKPVNFGFLDFTTLEQRRDDCQREVDLNRRLSPEVYLGVVEIRSYQGQFAIEGLGETVEYAVKMCRLPADRLMAHLLSQGQVTTNDIQRLAEKIARFHADAETCDKIIALGGVEAVRQDVEENFVQTQRYVGECLSRDVFDNLEAYSKAFLDAKEGLFRRRAAEQRVRDCHGDLHTAQIFLEDGISIIDCIEFNERFRYSDVAADIAFLAMDLDFHGRRDLADLFIETYVQASGDPGVLELMDFYKAYRAYVRGKVTCFRLEDTALSEEEHRDITSLAQAYFRLAHSYIGIPASPTLVLVAGLSGTGKSTIAQELARRWGLVYISSDITRKELAGIAPIERRFESYGQGIYSPAFSRRTYDAMLKRARGELQRGHSVVLDATFRRAKERALAVALAQGMGVEVWAIECLLAEDEVRRRLDERQKQEGSVSDGRWELFPRQREEWEPIGEVSASRHLRVNTAGPLQDVMRRLLLSWFRVALQSA